MLSKKLHKLQALNLAFPLFWHSCLLHFSTDHQKYKTPMMRLQKQSQTKKAHQIKPNLPLLQTIDLGGFVCIPSVHFFVTGLTQQVQLQKLEIHMLEYQVLKYQTIFKKLFLASFIRFVLPQEFSSTFCQFNYKSSVVHCKQHFDKCIKLYPGKINNLSLVRRCIQIPNQSRETFAETTTVCYKRLQHIRVLQL